MNHLTESQTQELQELLHEEHQKLESLLVKKGGLVDEDGDWIASADDIDEGDNDEAGEMAELKQEMFERSASLAELEARLAEVTGALSRMEDGSYGICEESGKEISIERLFANPAARVIKEKAFETAQDEPGIFEDR